MEPVSAGVPQGSILGPLLFLVYINDITEIVSSDIQLFADDTFIRKIVDGNSTDELNSDLKNISDWAWQWKMVFNPDISKQALEIIFSMKRVPSVLPPLVFNDLPVKLVEYTKHIGMTLDNRLNFKKHLEEKIAKANQGLGIMIQLKKWVTYQVLEIIYKLYVRPHLNYGDILYHIANTNKNKEIFELFSCVSLLQQIESIQYQAARIVTGAWKGSSRDKLYKMLGWESLNNRRIMRKLTMLHETHLNSYPLYLDAMFNEYKYPENHRKAEQLKLKPVFCKKSLYPKTFLPSTIKDWNDPALEIKSSKSKINFQKKITKQNPAKKIVVFWTL